MTADNLGRNLGPSVNICPNCQQTKPPNQARCPTCNARFCPKCGSALDDSQWICRGTRCNWKDVDWKPKKRNLAVRTPGERQFEDIHTGYYQCPHCRLAFSYERSAAIKCPGCGSLMGNGDPYRITLEKFKKARLEIPGRPQESVVSEPLESAFKSSSAPVGSYNAPVKMSPLPPRAPDAVDYRKIADPVSFEISKDREHFRDEMGAHRFKMPGIDKFLPWLYGLGTLVVLAGIGYGIWALISSGVFTSTSTPVVRAPETLSIDSVHLASFSDFSARITWHTEKPSTSQVEYGTTPALGEFTEVDTQMVTDHSVDLKNLKADTPYFFRVKSTAGNVASDLVAVGEFKTAALPDNAPPIISDIRITNISDIEAVISWKTNEKSTGSIRFGTSTSYGQSVVAGKDLALEHSVKLNGLSSSTSYHFIISSVDASKNTADSADTTFLTLEPVKEGYNVGNRAPDFTLKTVGGKSVTLSALRGQPVVLTFWRIACPACVYELPFIEEVYKGLNSSQQANQPKIFTVNLMDYEEHVNNLLNENHYTFPILMDFKGEAMSAYGLRSIPMTFFIDANGIVRRVQTGRFENAAELREILSSL